MTEWLKRVGKDRSNKKSTLGRLLRSREKRDERERQAVELPPVSLSDYSSESPAGRHNEPSDSSR